MLDEGPACLVVVIMGRFVHRQDRREAGVARLAQPAPFVARFREELRPDLLLAGRPAGRVRRIAEFVRIEAHPRDPFAIKLCLTRLLRDPLSHGPSIAVLATPHASEAMSPQSAPQLTPRR